VALLTQGPSVAETESLRDIPNKPAVHNASRSRFAIGNDRGWPSSTHSCPSTRRDLNGSFQVLTRTLTRPKHKLLISHCYVCEGGMVTGYRRG